MYTNLLLKSFTFETQTDLVRRGAITSWRVTCLLWDRLIIKFIRETGALQRGSHRTSYRDNIVFLFKQNTTCLYRIYIVLKKLAFSFGNHLGITSKSPAFRIGFNTYHVRYSVILNNFWLITWLETFLGKILRYTWKNKMLKKGNLHFLIILSRFKPRNLV